MTFLGSWNISIVGLRQNVRDPHLDMNYVMLLKYVVYYYIFHLICGRTVVTGKSDFAASYNKDTDQYAHHRSLISIFVICFLENILAILATCNWSIV